MSKDLETRIRSIPVQPRVSAAILSRDWKADARSDVTHLAQSAVEKSPTASNRNQSGNSCKSADSAAEIKKNRQKPVRLII
jgi:hypothetical protein